MSETKTYPDGFAPVAAFLHQSGKITPIRGGFTPCLPAACPSTTSDSSPAFLLSCLPALTIVKPSFACYHIFCIMDNRHAVPIKRHESTEISCASITLLLTCHIWHCKLVKHQEPVSSVLVRRH